MTSELNSSITNEIFNLDIPDNVKSKANEIVLQMYSGVRRSQKRKMLIFACAYYAYLELGKIAPPLDLWKIVGLKDYKKTAKCLTTYSFINTGYKPPLIFFESKHFLSQFAQKEGLSEHLEMIMMLNEEIMNKAPYLCEITPQTIAAALIAYYSKYNGINLNISPEKLSYNAAVTIKNHVARLESIHNS